MLFKQRFLDGIAAGAVTLAFRRWRRPTVRPGGTQRTAAGVLGIDHIDIIDIDDLTERDAKQAGFDSLAALLDDLRTQRPGTLYRIALHYRGADPRIALREQNALSEPELADLRRRLARLDAGAKGAWTRTILQLIADRPEVRAGDLAAATGMDKEWLKTHVRKLKELGLTESLLPGYRLSPRGRAVLRRLTT